MDPSLAPSHGDNLTRSLRKVDQILFNQGGTGGGGIPEAPTDGKLYGRENVAWAVVPPVPAGLLVTPGLTPFTVDSDRYMGAGFVGPPSVGAGIPDYTPATNYYAYLKTCFVFLSQYGPAPAGCQVTFYVFQTSTPIAVTAPLDASGLSSSAPFLLVPVLAAAQNVMYTRNLAQGSSFNYNVGLSVAPSNAASNPALGFGCEFVPFAVI